MQLLIDVRGHGYIDPAQEAAVRAAVDALRVACTAANFPVKADYQAVAHPDEASSAAVEPIPSAKPRSSVRSPEAP